MEVRSTDGLRLWVRREGPSEGPPVLLVHAFPLGAWMWDTQLRALSSQVPVAAYDVRGFGRSEVGDGQFTMETLVDDLLEVLDALGWERAVLCGLSMGGYIVLRAAERAPERLLGLVLCDTRSAADDDAGRLKRAAVIRRVKHEGLEAWVDDFLEQALAPRTGERSPDLALRIREGIVANAPLGVCGAQLAMAARTDTTAVLPEISVPTLVVAGEDDALTPPGTALEMAARLPDAEVVIVPGAGHLSNLENPDAFDDALRGLLRRLGEGSGRESSGA